MNRISILTRSSVITKRTWFMLSSFPKIGGFLEYNSNMKPQYSQAKYNMICTLVESVSIASIYQPYSSESNESSPRFICSIDTLFPPARSPSQSSPPFSFSIETFFPPARSPSQLDSSGNYEEIFPIDPSISTCSRRTLRALESIMTEKY